MLRRRQDILDAARALFNAKSYDSVTMDEIAEEADLSRATLYNHFDSKESIYFQIGIQYLIGLRERQRASITSVTSGLDQIITLSEDFLKALFEDPIIREIWRRFQSIHENELASNSIHSSFFRESQELEQIWSDVIKRGIEDGSIQERIDTDRLIHSLYLIILGIVDSVNSSRTLLTRTNFTVEDMMEFTIDLIRNYLTTQDNIHHVR